MITDPGLVRIVILKAARAATLIGTTSTQAAGWQHACLAVTPADDDPSQAAGRPDDDHPRPGLAAAGRMPAC